MRILLSVFACQPFSGSEGGVGWRWMEYLSRDHEVVVLTDMCRKELIAKGLHLLKGRNVEFHYYRPEWLKSVSMGRWTAHFLYVAWQAGVLGYARALHAKKPFDYAHHLTYGVFRHPSFLGSLGIPFIFGPVGGGEDAPAALKRSIPWQDKFKEWLRSGTNALFKYEPSLRYGLRSADLIFVRTDETRRALPAFTWPRVVVSQEIGVEVPADLGEREAYRGQRPIKLIFAGRLLHWKGAHFVVRALAQVKRAGIDFRLVLLGDGPKKAWLEAMARELNVEEHIEWRRTVPQPEFFPLLAQADLMVFPSLHDSGGNVSLEAMACGVPVITLDCGGPKTLVTPEAAVIIATPGRSEEQVVADIACAIEALARDPDRLAEMRLKALKHAQTMSWDLQIGRVMSRVQRLLDERKAGSSTL